MYGVRSTEYIASLMHYLNALPSRVIVLGWGFSKFALLGVERTRRVRMETDPSSDYSPYWIVW